MAVLSDVHKYTIRHVNDPEGTDVEIPVYPTSDEDSINLISKAWNNMYGEFRGKPINSKLKLDWIFDAVEEDKLKILVYDLIYSKILLYKSMDFYINSYKMGFGFVKGKFYLGSPTTMHSLAGNSNDGSIAVSKGEIHWIEVDGIVLNKPTSV